MPIDLLLKGGVGKAVAEGILNLILVGDQAFLSSGLIELVADIDALYIVYEGHIAFISGIGGGDLVLQIIHVGVGEISKVVPGRSSRQILYEGIRRLAGRIHGTVHDLTQSGETGVAGAGSQDHGADLGILIHPAQLHGVVGVDDDNDLVKLGADLLDHVLFGDGELQIVLARLEVVIAAVVGVNAFVVAVLVRSDGDLAAML